MNVWHFVTVNWFRIEHCETLANEIVETSQKKDRKSEPRSSGQRRHHRSDRMVIRGRRLLVKFQYERKLIPKRIVPGSGFSAVE